MYFKLYISWVFREWKVQKWGWYDISLSSPRPRLYKKVIYKVYQNELTHLKFKFGKFRTTSFQIIVMLYGYFKFEKHQFFVDPVIWIDFEVSA